MVSVFFVGSSSTGGGSGDVRAVAVDWGAGDMVVPLEEGSTEVGSSITSIVPATVVSEWPIATDSRAGLWLDVAAAYDSAVD
jgi:hypothetical protein